MQEEFLSGRFDSVDDLLTAALHALREKNHVLPTQAEAIERRDRKQMTPQRARARILLNS